MAEAPYRYTAELAGQIEQKWQKLWLEQGTFNAVNPVGELSDGRSADSSSCSTRGTTRTS